MTDSQVYSGSILLGLVAGMRSMSSAAIVSGLLQQGLLPASSKPLQIMAHPASMATTALMAAGEIVADKLPFVPARIGTAPLIARSLAGALSGAALSAAKDRSILFGALVGSCAAIGATYASYYARRSVGERSGIPDPVLAVVEDALVAASGWLLVRSLQSDRDINSERACGPCTQA